MERVKRKIYHKDGLRLLFRDPEDFARFADALSSEQRLDIENAGKNCWTPECKDYPFFIAVDHLGDADYLYLDNLLKSLDLSEAESNESVNSV